MSQDHFGCHSSKHNTCCNCKQDEMTVCQYGRVGRHDPEVEACNVGCNWHVLNGHGSKERLVLLLTRFVHGIEAAMCC